MNGVAIVLSTYNGERFITDQLESFRTQTYTNWRLFWRDDGSSDRSCDLVDAFGISLPPGQCVLLDDGRRHRGIAGSFLWLLQRFVATGADDLVAFADQDDIWLPEKLARAVEALRRCPSHLPALYCARQMLVDQQCRTLGPSPETRRPPGFPASLAQNIATGCTVVLNSIAARLIASLEPPSSTLHDWWSYLVVTAAGGQILVDGIPTVLYRQHGGNAVGASRTAVQRGAAALRRGPNDFMTLLQQHVAALRAAGTALPPAASGRLAAIERALRGGLSGRLHVLRELHLDRQTWAETAVFNLWFMIG